MAIKKQEFYEGAAIHVIARSGAVSSIRYKSPFFYFNGALSVLLKYSTRGRSPWSFTFTLEEQTQMRVSSMKLKTVVALICGSDGIAAFEYSTFLSIAAPRQSSIRISCYRGHGEYYEVNGPDGTSSNKIAPSNWQRILENTEF